jgi:hypothetical protein
VQCCVTGTGTFCLSGTGMHFGSGLGSGSVIYEKGVKVKKIQKGNENFIGNNAESNIKKARFLYTIFYLKKCAKFGLGPWIQIRIWNRNRNRNFSEIGPGTGINSLFLCLFFFEGTFTSFLKDKKS